MSGTGILIAWGVSYLVCGAALQMISIPGLLLRGYVVSAIIWPWVLWANDTPRIRPLLRWARGERVIERSEWPVGVFHLTIQCCDGSDYTERTP